MEVGVMANFQIEIMDDAFYGRIKALADSENRSISQQVSFLLKGRLYSGKNDG